MCNNVTYYFPLCRGGRHYVNQYNIYYGDDVKTTWAPYYFMSNNVYYKITARGLEDISKG